MKKIINELFFCIIVISSFTLITTLIQPYPHRKQENKHSNSSRRTIYFQSKHQDQ